MSEQIISKRTSQSKYQKTEKGKATIKHYQQSEKFKATQKRYRQSEKGKIAQRKRSKKYYQTEKGKVARKRGNKNFKARNPNYEKSHNTVNHAIKIGKLPRPDTQLCHYCPKPAQQYHHHKGYAPENWLDVVPVCRKCHNKIPKDKLIAIGPKTL